MSLRLRYSDLGPSRANGDYFLPGLGWIVLGDRLLSEWQSCRWRGAVEVRWCGCCWLGRAIVLLGYERAA